MLCLAAKKVAIDVVGGQGVGFDLLARVPGVRAASSLLLDSPRLTILICASFMPVAVASDGKHKNQKL